MAKMTKESVKTLSNYSEYVVIEKEISQATIAEARYKFSSLFGEPTEIRLGSKAIRDMCAEIGIDKLPGNFSVETMQGLIIMLDPTLRPDEWLVGRSQSIVRERKQ